MIRKLVLFYFVSLSIFAQGIGTWKNYSDMKSTKAIVLTNDGLWAATSGGVFNFNFADSSYNIITKADGLSSQILTSITSDNEGRVWIGSEEGYINSYSPDDGSIIKVLDIYNSDKSKKQINHLFISNDTVFVSTDFGISLINSADGSFFDSFLKFGDFAAETSIKYTYKDNLLYVATDLGIAVQKEGSQNLSAPESWDSYLLGTGIAATTVNSIGKFENKISAATDNGLFEFNNGQWTSYLFAGTNIIQFGSAGNTFYLISDTKLYSFENNQINTLYENDNIQFNSIQIENDGTVYCATSEGVLHYKNGSIKFLYPNGPESNTFVNLSIDNNGNLWVATGTDVSGVGIFKFDGQNWTTYNTSNTPSFQSNAFYSVNASGSKVYFGNWGKGITVYDGNVFKTYNAFNSSLTGTPDDPHFVVIYDTKTDSKGNAWMTNFQSASRAPLSVLTPDSTIYNFEFRNPIITESGIIRKLAIDQYDTKWFIVTSGNSGVYYFNDNGTLNDLSDDVQGYISSSNGLLSDDITALVVDKRGQLWVGTNIGISLIQDVTNPKASISNSVGFALRNLNVTSIVVDPLNQKWIATNNGVFVYSPDCIQLLEHYTASNSPIPNDNIRSLAIDEKNGIVYIGTDFGLSSLTTPSMQPQESFTDLFVYPNPLIVQNNSTNTVTIDGLVSNSLIKIFDINGKLIANFASPGGRVAFWNGRDLDGNYVSSGVYVIVAYDEEANNVATTKLAVIKK